MVTNILKNARSRKAFFSFFLICLLGVANSLQAEPLRVLVFGDSLAAGFGLPENEGFSPQLEDALLQQGIEAEVINGGVSGDTTYSALARADVTLKIPHDVLIIELGANDMLRGLPPAMTKSNLSELISKSQAPVYLLGMRSMPNLTPNYTRKFDAIYGELSKQYNTGLYPFVMKAVFNKGLRNAYTFFQADFLHPNTRGIELITGDIAPELADWLRDQGLAS